MRSELRPGFLAQSPTAVISVSPVELRWLLSRFYAIGPDRNRSDAQSYASEPPVYPEREVVNDGRIR